MAVVQGLHCPRSHVIPSGGLRVLLFRRLRLPFLLARRVPKVMRPIERVALASGQTPQGAHTPRISCPVVVAVWWFLPTKLEESGRRKLWRSCDS